MVFFCSQSLLWSFEVKLHKWSFMILQVDFSCCWVLRLSRSLNKSSFLTQSSLLHHFGWCKASKAGWQTADSSASLYEDDLAKHNPRVRLNYIMVLTAAFWSYKMVMLEVLQLEVNTLSWISFLIPGLWLSSGWPLQVTRADNRSHMELFDNPVTGSHHWSPLSAGQQWLTQGPAPTAPGEAPSDGAMPRDVMS